MAKMIEKIASIGSFIFGVISLIVCATAAGTKNTLFIPLVVVLVLGCILAAVALFVFYRQQRRQGEILDDDEKNFLETYGHLILTTGATIFYLIGLILFIVTKANGGLSLGDTYKTEHNALEQQLAELGIGSCDNFKATSGYCNRNKAECNQFITTCMEKADVVHAEAYVSFVFVILAMVFAALSAFFAFKTSRQEGDEEYGTYQPNTTTVPRNGNRTTFKSDYVPGDNRMQSPLV